MRTGNRSHCEEDGLSDFTSGAGSRGWQHLPRTVDRRQRQHHRRSRLQYRHHGLSGNSHRPVVLPPDRHLTYPHIGNTGTTPEDMESGQVYAAGLVIRDLSLVTSSWRGRRVAERFPAARRGGRHRRHRHPPAHAPAARKGAQAGCIMTGEASMKRPRCVRRTRFPGLKGMDLAKVVSDQGELSVERGQHRPRRRIAQHARRSSACTWWPTTSASSATSCACSPTRAAA